MGFIDAAKRRNLPGWIREGLEKMEREKQRKIEREIQMKEREEMLRQKIQEEEEALAEADEPMIPKKSKFVSTPKENLQTFESKHTHYLCNIVLSTFLQESDSEDEEKQSSNQEKRKSRFSDAESPNRRGRSPSPEPDEPPKSKEELMQEVVRLFFSLGLSDILVFV